MNYVNNYFDSRDLFFNKFPLSESKRAETILKGFTGERDYAPITEALLNLGSALICYNSSTRFFTQKVVAMENSMIGIWKKIYLTYTRLEDREVDGLIYTACWLSGYQQQGEALAIARDLLGALPTSLPETLPDLNETLRIFYDLTFLGLYISPQGFSFILLLKVSKVAYFALKEYSESSHSWSKIQDTTQKPTLANVINLLANGIHLYGNTLQLYKAGTVS